jgi:seryl-tRNA(Sec) selenium transferase
MSMPIASQRQEKDMTEDIRSRIGLRPVINVSGTMTSLGASIVVPEAVEAMAAILPQFVEINDLQRKASAVISRVTGGEAGFVTASCSSGISLAVAGAITGNNLLAIEKLPDVTPEKNEVLVQMGHVVSYGAPVDQAIRLGGGKVVLIGQATSTHRFHMENAITEKTAARTMWWITACCIFLNSSRLPMPRACLSSWMRLPNMI